MYMHTHIVIVISKLLKRYSKAKRTRAPAYSRALRRIKGGLQRGSEEAQVRFPEYQVIVIVISRFLKRYSKSKRTRAPAYFQATLLYAAPAWWGFASEGDRGRVERFIGRLMRSGYGTSLKKHQRQRKW